MRDNIVRLRGSQRDDEAPQAVSQVVKAITEKMLRLELDRAIADLGPARAAQVVVAVFRLRGLPKVLRRHL